MQSFLYRMAVATSAPAAHAWMVTRDVLAEDGEDGAVGVLGPGEAPEHLCEALRAMLRTGVAPEHLELHPWVLWDDDGVRCAEGVLVSEHADPSEDETGANGALSAPLTDYGEGMWGCTRITWPHHPEWDAY